MFVVDDQSVIAMTLGFIFRQAGFEAAYFTDTLDLLTACKTAIPDVVVSDLMMPHMTGVDLAQELEGSIRIATSF